MASLFRSNTHHHHQPSGLQQAIEKATDGNQSSEDWSLIMQICDHVGRHEESAKEAMKTIRKRLQLNPPATGWRSVGLTLTLLEALVKNCGKIIHLQVAQKDFLKELKGVIGPKNNPPVLIQERVLGMIQTWALAFRDDPDLKNVDHFYQECKQQGLVFPAAESENVIKTAVPSTRTMDRPLQATRSMSRTGTDGVSYPPPPPANNQTATQKMSAEQLAKLRSELDVVQTNAQVFGEMLVTLQPGEENPQDFELLMELHNTCKQMQARIVDLLAQISIDDITVDLLRYNDELNNSFKTFESYMEERNRRCGSSQMPNLNRNISPSRTTQSSTTKPIPSPRNVDNEPALIRFDDEPITLSNNFNNMQLNPTSSSAIPKYTPQQQPIASSATIRPAANNQDPESEVREIEHWLKIQGDEPDIDEPSRQDNGTTAAFNNFLQKRASTIPDQPVSENQVYVNFQQPPTHNPQNKTYL